jgi:hypothetical protein
MALDAGQTAAVNNAIATAIANSLGAVTSNELADISKGFKNSMDPDRLLGFERRKKVEQRKSEAYLDPRVFQKARADAQDKMYEKVREAYVYAYEQYIAAGFKHDDAVVQATKISAVMTESLDAAINAEFGNDAVAINQKRLVQKAELENTSGAGGTDWTKT